MTEIIQQTTILKLGLPKGRMSVGIIDLLRDAGISVSASERGYRPLISLPDATAKTLKPQNIIEMLVHGRRDAGFAGADWVRELNADVVEIMDTTLDTVRLVAAVPSGLLVNGSLPSRRLVVTSEYEQIAREWIQNKGLDAEFVRSYGATEVFPPDDADLIIDIVATGATLRANNLVIFETLMTSSTRFYASVAARNDPVRRERIDAIKLLLESVLEARKRVMLEINASINRGIRKKRIGTLSAQLKNGNFRSERRSKNSPNENRMNSRIGTSRARNLYFPSSRLPLIR